MGTTSVTKFYEKYNTEKHFIGGFYRSSDGYISGHGKDLKNLLQGKKIIDGTNNSFSGIDSIGIYIIAKFHEKIGDIYLTVENENQSYNYEIWNENEEIFIKIINYNSNIIYEGHIDNMSVEDE